MREVDLKGQIKDYLNIKRIFNYHLLQGMGSYRGLPDKVMHLNGRIVYLEIKLPGRKLSYDQEIFKQQCEYDDIPYFVIHSIEELEEVLNERYHYLGG